MKCQQEHIFFTIKYVRNFYIKKEKKLKNVFKLASVIY